MITLAWLPQHAKGFEVGRHLQTRRHATSQGQVEKQARASLTGLLVVLKAA
eukprot:m.71978 g.71978  ORF g.71978 m.71978 type:complete len:51 (-) comp14232_c0_seq1:269-421(-)